MKAFMFLLVFFCITSYCYGRAHPVRVSDPVKSRICGIVKEIDMSSSKDGNIIFTDGKTIGLEKASVEHYGFSMALASMQNGLTFCCDAGDTVCKTEFSLSK